MGNCEDTQLLCDRFERQCFKYKQSIKLILKGLLFMMQGKGMISVNLCSTLLGTWFQEKKKKEIKNFSLSHDVSLFVVSKVGKPFPLAFIY